MFKVLTGALPDTGYTERVARETHRYLPLCISCWHSKPLIPTTLEFISETNTVIHIEDQDDSSLYCSRVLIRTLAQACFHWQEKIHILFLTKTTETDFVQYGITVIPGVVEIFLYGSSPKADFEGYCRRVSDLGFDIWLALSRKKREELTNGFR